MKAESPSRSWQNSHITEYLGIELYLLNIQISSARAEKDVDRYFGSASTKCGARKLRGTCSANRLQLDQNYG